MTEEDKRQTGELRGYKLGERSFVLNEGVPAVFLAEIAQLLIALGGSAVADMVVNKDGKALAAEEFCEILITLAVLRHAVNYLEYRLRTVGGHPATGKNIGNTRF